MFTSLAIALALQGGKVETNPFTGRSIIVNAVKGNAKTGTAPKVGFEMKQDHKSTAGGHSKPSTKPIHHSKH